ncbi:MAG: CopD family protein [Chloroflexi bacterium]|nr:CopD family protein [Chloroflexota bacterium]
MFWSNGIVIIHVLAAMVWVGGMLFLSLVAVPATRGWEPALRARALRALGRRFRVVGWIALGVLIVTGLLNAARYGYDPLALLRGEWLASGFGQALTAKLALVLLMVALTLAHDVVSVRTGAAPTAGGAGGRPGADGGTAPGPPSAPPKAAPRRVAWLGRLNLLVALAVVVLAVLLVRGAW